MMGQRSCSHSCDVMPCCLRRAFEDEARRAEMRAAEATKAPRAPPVPIVSIAKDSEHKAGHGHESKTAVPSPHAAPKAGRVAPTLVSAAAPTADAKPSISSAAAQPPAAPKPGHSRRVSTSGNVEGQQIPSMVSPPSAWGTPPLSFEGPANSTDMPSNLDAPPGYASEAPSASAAAPPDVGSVRASMASWEEQRREAEEIRARLLERKERLIRGMNERSPRSGGPVDADVSTSYNVSPPSNRARPPAVAVSVLAVPVIASTFVIPLYPVL